ncbi:inositol monophosphatase family protein [Trabulsiella odontotermitis]|uniref:inositol monophosphatase family protein n=1 Tax=Trabulsiella odontotermitis TaxID=379893 RepID=UPI00067613C4|nr:inositol monophosphatase family protein [Trabulsiella odontotermitis]
MNKTEINLRFLAACATAREAGMLVRTRFLERDNVLKLKFKGPQDYLTETDGEVEQLIARRLADVFPDDAFLGEEYGGDIDDKLWVVDPIDGTADFARGVPYFCVSIAFVLRGNTEIGIVYDPMADELFTAIRGGGARLNNRPIKVSEIAKIEESVIELGWSSRVPFDGYARVHARFNELGASVKRCGSGALGLVYVAMGRQDAYCELHINAWDAAAAALIVQESGGWTNPFLTPECLQRGNEIIACTPQLRNIIEESMMLGH